MPLLYKQSVGKFLEFVLRRSAANRLQRGFCPVHEAGNLLARSGEAALPGDAFDDRVQPAVLFAGIEAANFGAKSFVTRRQRLD